MSKPEFVYVTYIETTPDRLWWALTDRDFIQSYWMDCELISDWKVGSPMTMKRYGEIKNECVILESDPPRRLSYSWHSVFDPEMKKETPSRVTYTLEPQGKVVKLISSGWPMVLSNLKSILETGKPLPLDPPVVAASETAHRQGSAA